MPLSAAQQAALSAAIDRLQNYYDGDNPYNPQTNPGGFRQGGQVVNFEPALKDTATVMRYGSVLVADAVAAAAASPKAVRVDSQQSFVDSETDQGRWNLRGPVPLSTSADTVLTVLDAGRDVFATGSPKITAANGGAGWRSGPILNDNAVTGLVTLAVPSGATLDGVQNGITLLFPFQKARIRQVGAAAYRTIWIDRTPIVAVIAASGVTSADANLPVGYQRFSIDVSNVASSVNGDTLNFRVSDNGVSGVKSGASDYTSNRIGVGGTTSPPGSAQSISSAGLLIAVLGNNFANLRGIGKYLFSPATAPSIVGISQYYDSTPQNTINEIGCAYSGGTSGAIGRTNLFRFLAGSGLMTLNATIRGEV